MDAAKKRRLNAGGWVVGNAKAFLGLSDEEAVFIELKLDLARSVRRGRLKLQMTQTQLATRLESSQSRVAKVEAGDPTVSFDLLVRALLAVGMTRREIAKVIAGGTRRPSV